MADAEERWKVAGAATADPGSDEDVIALVREYPLAWVVAAEAHASPGARLAATPLPILADAENGRLTCLVGHFALSNPQVAILEASPRALFLFQGPHGYISPSWMSDRTWAPTWNYAAAEVEADVRFLPDEGDIVLARLVRQMEAGRPNAWSATEMGERYDRLRPHIIAFNAEVRAVHTRFKLGQDERKRVFGEILAASNDAKLNRWMTRFRAED